jgi:hypothetical protein
LFLKQQHTNAEDNTSAQFVVTPAGCRERDHQLKVFIENFCDQKNFLQKIVYYL